MKESPKFMSVVAMMMVALSLVKVGSQQTAAAGKLLSEY